MTTQPTENYSERKGNIYPNAPTPLLVNVPNGGTGFFANWSAADKQRVLLVGGGILIGGIAWYIIRKKIQQAQIQAVEKQVVYEDAPASFTQSFINAFENWGTDENVVFQAFADMPTLEFYAQVAKAYAQRVPDHTLGGDLGIELDSQEMQVVKNILASKPKTAKDKPKYFLLENWVSRLTLAADGMGTDEQAIYRVLYEVPDKSGVQLLNQRYKEKSKGVSLFDMMEQELDTEELTFAQAIIQRKK